MRNVGIVLFVSFLIVALALAFASFQVRETESALVTTFGRATREITEPDWYFKWPPPIQSVHKFDSRMRVLEVQIGETTTKGAKSIILDPYVVWRIDKPLAFYNAHGQGSIRDAEDKLRYQIRDTINRIVGRYSFGEFVNSDPERIQLARIEQEMLTDMKKAVADADYGIEIRTLGIKHLKISEDVSKKVFDRMRTARNRMTEKTISEGKALATEISSNADAMKVELLAAAKARATAIRGQGDAEAAKYYKLLDKDPDFAIFLRETQALKEMLKEQTTLVIPADAGPLKLLKESPVLKPAEPNSTDARTGGL